ncbi:hypothetical protein ScPMuIL_002812 [Solemya velum]
MASPIGQRDMAPSNSLPSTTPRRGAQDKLPALDEYDAWPSSSAATSTTASTTDFVDCRDRDDGKTRTLTVKQTAKINKAMEQKVPDRIGASKIVTLFKWIGTIVCGCMLLGSLVYSKLSIIILSRKLNETNVDEEGTPSGEGTRCFLMLVLLLLVPNVFNFFRAVWVAGFRKDFPWPKRTSMLLGLLTSILESAGLCVFVLKVLSFAHPADGLLLMNGIFIIPILNKFIMCFLHRGDSTIKKWSILFFIALLFELTGLALILYIQIEWLNDNNLFQTNFWHGPVAILCLSFAWSPWLQNKLTLTETEDEKPVEEDSFSAMDSNPQSRTASQSSGYITTTSDILDRQKEVRVRFSIPEKETTKMKSGIWKMTIFMSGVKVFFILIFSFLLYYIDQQKAVSPTKAWDVFKSAWDWVDSGRDVYYFVGNLLSGFLGYLVALIACRTCMQRGAFATPLFLSTPIAAVVLRLDVTCKYLFSQSTTCSPENYSPLVYFASAAGCLLLAQIFSTGWLVFRDNCIVLLPETQIFWLPTYNSALLEQWLLLARKTNTPMSITWTHG